MPGREGAAEINQHDLISERCIIGFLLQQGANVLSDIETLLSEDDFFDQKNQAIYACIRDIINETDAKSVTIDAILTTAKKLNLDKLITVDDIKFLKLCRQQSLSQAELPKFIKQVKFWSVVRQLKNQVGSIEKYLTHLTGQETLGEVIASTEENILGFLPKLLQEDEIIDLSKYSSEYIEFLAENPVDVIGVPSGFPKWDHCIGGGLRRGSVNVVGARAKVGKSFYCLNVASNVVKQNIPCLYLDTELNKNVQSTRWTALHSKVETDLIEKGEFAASPHFKKQVADAIDSLKNFPFDYTTVAGRSPAEIVSIMRRWISKRVKRDENGQTKPCLIILDYLKTMDLKELGNFQEHQYLGDIMTKMHNFAVKYDVPILVTTQLNRDGITRDTSDVVSSSDRILWLCSSLSFLKNKTPEDVASGDPLSNGNKKLIVIDTRFGEGMDPTSTYINIITSLNRAEMKEGDFNYENTDQAIDDIIDDDETII